MKTIKLQLAFLLIMLSSIATFAQNFEGSIIYKLEALNPNPKMIPDSSWQKILVKQFGEHGYMIQKYFYKKDKYISEIDAGKSIGYQAYNPKTKLLYSWQANSDTVVTINTKIYMDNLIEITDSEVLDTISGIPCKSIVVKSALGEMKLWYNSDYFKMDASLYQDHKYGHWEQILTKIGCLPMRMEQKGFMTNIVQTIIEFKEEPIEDAKFSIPKFKKTIKNPVN
jgi:hypothetical protein